MMGESAAAHAAQLIDQGRLICDDPDVVWEWNHLIAFEFLPTRRAQTVRLLESLGAINNHNCVSC